MKEFRNERLQKKLDILPDASTILFNEIKDPGNRAYAIGKPQNNKDRTANHE